MLTIFSLIGVWLNITGVIGLFLFGMPFHVPRKGDFLLISSKRDDKEVRKEYAFSFLSWSSLALIIVSAVFQTMAVCFS
ncbi:hypothetical protein SAMN04488518_109239 [Pseudovibrio ascidiaceicola]|uniref:DUF4149 domain-containing protein n=1 Tax=Pseudovibrio ascidiaceicola TaxID=285279 RepID=A0A1I4CPA6_9HYPH|nr:hypothetical protein SAMN04488518_109239 [Pseudovibrio ascidiaceicola]